MIEKHSGIFGKRACGVAYPGSVISSSRPHDLHQRLPARRLDDHIDIVVGAARRAAQRRARLAAARGVAGARHRVAEFLVRVFGQRPAHQPLLVAHLDPAQIQHRVGHRDLDPLALAGALALIERGEDAGDRVDAGAAVADLRAGHGRRPVLPAGRAGRPAHALRDILIGLAIGVRPGAEPLDRGVDDPRVQLLKALPGEALPVEHAGAEILDDDVAAPDQLLDHRLALRRLQVDGDAALVRVQHREIEAVGALHVLQLAAGDVAAAGHLDLDHVGAHPRQQLRPGRARLDMAQIENAHTFESFAHPKFSSAWAHHSRGIRYTRGPGNPLCAHGAAGARDWQAALFSLELMVEDRARRKQRFSVAPSVPEASHARLALTRPLTRRTVSHLTRGTGLGARACFAGWSYAPRCWSLPVSRPACWIRRGRSRRRSGSS